jgi:hypothetical protein
VALAELDRAEVFPNGVVSWAPLGPGWLHATIITGEIISKTAAAGYTAKLLPEHGGLLARARAHRLGDDRECFAVAEGYDACDLIDAVVNDAASIASR